MPYPDSVLRRGEHVLAHRRPHWRMLALPALVVPVVAFFAAFAAAVATGVPAETARTAVRVAVVVLAAGVVLWWALLPLLRWRTTHFVVTDRRLLVREGVVTRESVDVAGASISSVRTRTTGRGRLVGCGTLVVGTSATAEPWEFAGLGGVEHLAALTEEMAAARGGLREPDPEDEDDDWGSWSVDDDEPDEDPDEDEPPPVTAGIRRRRSARRTSR